MAQNFHYADFGVPLSNVILTLNLLNRGSNSHTVDCIHHITLRLEKMPISSFGEILTLPLNPNALETT